MGVSVVWWRQKIGCFLQPRLGKWYGGHIGFHTDKLHVSLVMRVTLLLGLLLCGDIEANPGPKSTNTRTEGYNTRQAKLTDSLYSQTTPSLYLVFRLTGHLFITPLMQAVEMRLVL